jgi:small subunit ribosomal protein S16
MSTKLRLQRIGRTDKQVYKIVVIDESSKRNGRIIELIGQYDKTVKPAVLKYDKKIVEKWMSKGAQPTDTVRKILAL